MAKPKIIDDSFSSTVTRVSQKTTQERYEFPDGSVWHSKPFSVLQESTKVSLAQRKDLYKQSFSSHVGRYKGDGFPYWKTNPFHQEKLEIYMESHPSVQRVYDYVKTTKNRDGTLKSIQIQQDTQNELFEVTDFRARNPHVIGDNMPGARDAARAVNGKIGKIDVNAALAFAERRKTADLISSNARKIATSLDLVKTGYYKEASRALGVEYDGSKHSRFTRSFGPKWLEFIYGWKPLLSDIHGALTTPARTKISKFWVKASNSSQESWDEVDRSITIDYTTTYKTLVVINNMTEYTAQSLGLTNPMLIAWELVPYSFVLDWFLPVGGYLESLDSRLGTSLFESSSTYTVNETQTINAIPTSRWDEWDNSYVSGDYTFDTSQKVFGTPGKGTVSRKLKLRQLHFPDMPLPEFKNPLSVSHAITSVALLQRKRSHFN